MGRKTFSIRSRIITCPFEFLQRCSYDDNWWDKNMQEMKLWNRNYLRVTSYLKSSNKHLWYCYASNGKVRYTASFMKYWPSMQFPTPGTVKRIFQVLSFKMWPFKMLPFQVLSFKACHSKRYHAKCYHCKCCHSKRYHSKYLHSKRCHSKCCVFIPIVSTPGVFIPIV